MEAAVQTPLVQMKDISIAFGGLKAVDRASIDLYPGEVVGLLGHNGAGKSCLIKILSGAYRRDEGEIFINGQAATINNPRDAKHFGIETIYQTLALADNVDAASNLYLGRELLTRWGTLDDASMEAEARKVMGRLNPNFRRFKEPVMALSGGQRQSVAIARAIHFNARILVMDEPTAALGPAETAQVGELDQAAQGRGHRHFSHQPRHPRRLRSRRSRDGDEERPDRRQRPGSGHDQGRSARHDHPRQVPAWRDPRPGGDGELKKSASPGSDTGRRSAERREDSQAPGCHPCLRYRLSPLCPGWTIGILVPVEGLRTPDPRFTKPLLYQLS